MPESPIFLTLDEVLRIHSYQIETHGGSASVLDVGKIESAIAQPRQAFGGQYLHEDLAAMAAAYLYHIVQNHAFEDGNKRTGTHAALIFLTLNGYEVQPNTDEAEQLVVSVAKGEATKATIADYFRKLLKEQL